MSGRDYDLARNAGVIPIAHEIDSSAFVTLREMRLNLRNEIREEHGSFLDLGGIALTTFNMFETADIQNRLPDSNRSSNEKREYPDIPTSADIIRKLPELAAPFDATITGVAIYGLDKKPKLGLELISPKFDKNLQSIIDAYADEGVFLRPDLLDRDPRKQSRHHHSFAVFNEASKRYLDNPRARRSLGEKSGVIGKTITLLGITSPKS